MFKYKKLFYLRNIIFFIIKIFACYIMFILVTFYPFDFGRYQCANNNFFYSLFRSTGALIADVLFVIFGLVAYTLPCFIFFLNWKCVFKDSTLDFFQLTYNIIGVLLLLFGLCILAELHINDFFHCTSGGVIGSILYMSFFCFFNDIVLNITLILICILGITLFIGYSWLFIFKNIGHSVVKFIVYLYLLVMKYTNIWNIVWKWLYKFVQNFLLFRIYFQYIQFHKNIFYKNNNTYFPCFFTKKRNKFNNYKLQCIHYSFWNMSLFKQPLNILHSKNIVHSNITLKNSYTNLKYLDHSNYFDPQNIQLLHCTSYYKKNCLNIKDHTGAQNKNIVSQNKENSYFAQKHSSKKSLDLFSDINLLFLPSSSVNKIPNEIMKEKSNLLESKLLDYNIKAKVVNILFGPVLTRFELDLAPGLKSSRITILSRDLARALSVSSLKVIEVIPGKPYIGLEIPNKKREIVYLREVLDTNKFRFSCSPLTLCFGKDIIGEPVIADLVNMPHMLIAGTTGSGKSIGINAMIISILYKSSPEDVRFIMIDPKMLELSVYEGIPHLLKKVIVDMADVIDVLDWCVQEMERRYRIMSACGVRNLNNYNNCIQSDTNNMKELSMDCLKNAIFNCKKNLISSNNLEKLPHIVIIIDEFSDLIMSVGKKAEFLIVRLSQKARACGIHLILATQRPSVNVITGLIKANIPSRIAFTVSSKIDSCTILGRSGAESLLGMGDMLYLASDSSEPVRIHGAFVSDQEVFSVVSDWKKR